MAAASIKNISDVRKEKEMKEKVPMTAKRYWRINSCERRIVNQKIRAVKKEIMGFRAILVLGIVYGIVITLLHTMLIPGVIQVIGALALTVIYSVCAPSQKKKLKSKLYSLYISNPLYDIDKSGKEIRLKDTISKFNTFVNDTIPIGILLYYIIFGYILVECTITVLNGIF